MHKTKDFPNESNAWMTYNYIAYEKHPIKQSLFVEGLFVSSVHQPHPIGKRVVPL